MNAPGSDAFLGERVTVTFDRPLGSIHPTHGHTYPVNYGHLEGVLVPDGEELDAYVLGVETPLPTFTGTCIAFIHRADDVEEKLVVVPEGTALTDEEILAAVHFQERWFRSSVRRA